jgi:hypothetical protein
MTTSEKRVFCNKMKHEVRLTIFYSPHPFGQGFLPPFFECDSYAECLVGREDAAGTKVFDWSNCPFKDRLPAPLELLEATA